METVKDNIDQDNDSVVLTLLYPTESDPFNKNGNTSKYKISRDAIAKHSRTICSLLDDIDDDKPDIPIMPSTFYQKIYKTEDNVEVTIPFKPRETILRVLDFCRTYKDVNVPDKINRKDANLGWDMEQFDENYVASLNIDDDEEMMSLIVAVNLLDIKPFWFLIRDYCAKEIKKLSIKEQKEIWNPLQDKIVEKAKSE